MSGGGGVRPPSCSEVRDLAAELGLGVLVGVERADVIAHLDGCPSCRSLVDGMAETGDSLLSLGPEVEPPAGFESRLLERWTAERPEPVIGGHARRRRHGRRMLATAAVAAVAAVGGIGAGLGIATGSSPGRQVGSAAVVGRGLVAAPLRDGDRGIGQVFVYSGRPSWVFMDVEVDGPPRRVTCLLETKDGSTVDVGSFTVSAGYHAWGSTVTVEPALISSVRLVDARSQVVAAAAF